jgi:adenylate cyclase
VSAQQGEWSTDAATAAPLAVTAEPRVAGPPRLTLRATLLTLVLGLLLVTIALLAWINYASQAHSIADLEGRYFALASESVANKLRAPLEPAAPTLNEALYSVTTTRALAVDDDEDLLQYAAAQVRFVDSLAWFYYGAAADGRFVGARKEADGTIVLAHSAPGVDGGRRIEETLAADGTRSPHPSDVPSGFDPRQRPWFEQATATDNIAWTGPYTLFTQQELGITASRALRDGAGGLVGVFGLDITIRDLRSLLTSLVQANNGRAHLVDRAAAIIATSDEAGAAGGYPVMHAALAQSPTALATLPVDVPLTFTFDYAGEPWVAAMRAFPLQGDVEWATLYLTPESEFLRVVNETRRIALVLALALVLLAVVLAVRLSQGVSRPLRLLADDLARVGRFELSTRPAPRSPIREVVVLGDAVTRMKASLRSFGRFVPTEVVRDLLARGEEARLGGETRALTLHFSDIEGFTQISERMSPAEVVRDLAEYLEAMTGAIREYDGTVDKFMGDGIMAFWNAPNAVPDHAAQACRAALRAQECLAALREQWATAGRPQFRARIGLHTGDVLVGTLGTPERFSYTAIGDAVNLASRLEGQNKSYGTYILASEDTRAAAGPVFEWRRLDRVAVVGRTEPTPVYELLGEVGRVAPTVLAARDRYEAALEAYFAQRFEEAIAGFGAAAELRPTDRAATTMAQRAGNLQAYSPGPDWNGVHVATTK